MISKGMPRSSEEKEFETARGGKSTATSV